MQKTMGDMAKFLKQLIPVHIPETYTVNSMFNDISYEEGLHKGVLAFRDFLYRFCDCIIDDNSLCDVPKKGKNEFSDETTLSVEFPFLNNVRSILINIGCHGILSEEGTSLLVSDWEMLCVKKSLNKNSTAKMSASQMIKSIRFLAECGVDFDGINLSEKKPDISKIQTINITYPDNPIMLTGLKALATAEDELSSRNRNNILLRCDYRALKNEDTEASLALKDLVYPLSADMKDFVLQFHQHYIDLGMKCSIDSFMLRTYFIYSYKGKAIWRFSASLSRGYRMIIKTKNTSKYTDVIESFPSYLQQRISRGYGCNRKEGNGKSHGNCQRGCEGFSFSLDESTLEIGQYLQAWLDNEIFSMQKRSN